jgi:soluble lytic murein transglycosylase-like protein
MTIFRSNIRRTALRAAGTVSIVFTLASPGAQAQTARTADMQTLVAKHARQHGLPDTLAHRVIMRESRYNAHLRGRGHYGLMQISLPTARQMGYRGNPAGLLDAETNLTYAMPYLANAWIVSGGNESRAVSLYSSGYYYAAKRKGLLRALHTARLAPAETAEAAK